MAACSHCGAPITLSPTSVVVCEFCRTANQPPPKEVQVAVPVQIVNKVVQVVGAGSGSDDDARELRCPHCRKRLVTVRAGEIDLHGCGRCGGIWIDNASSQQVIAAPDPVLGDLAQRAATNAARDSPRVAHPTCASCPAVLEPVVVRGIGLDLCGDHGTWFDADELRHLVAAMRGEPAPAKPARQDTIVKCAGCPEKAPASQLNVGDSGLVCDACWRKRQAELRAAAQTGTYGSAGSAQGAFTAGALLGAVVLVAAAAAAGGSRRR